MMLCSSVTSVASGWAQEKFKMLAYDYQHTLLNQPRDYQSISQSMVYLLWQHNCWISRPTNR